MLACIVGSGPSGVYIAENLLKSKIFSKIDMIDSMKCPFGFVRYGVAPDRTELKNIIYNSLNYFSKLESKAFNFYPGVEIGWNVSLHELRRHYNIVFLCIGAQESKKLDKYAGFATTTTRKNVFHADEFVGWYNGSPKYIDLRLHSSSNGDIIKDVLLIGHGNVSLDIARMILKRSMDIKISDTFNSVFEKESKLSNVQEIKIVGRRGPKDVSFTTGELRDLLKIPHLNWKYDIDLVRADMLDSSLDRAKRRLLQLLVDQYSKRIEDINSSRLCSLHFFSCPRMILKRLNGTPIGVVFDLPDKTRTFLSAQLVIVSIGFFTPKLKELSYDDSNGHLLIDNAGLHVLGMEDVFPCGWALTEGKGTLAQAMHQSKIMVDMIVRNAGKYQKKMIDNENLFKGAACYSLLDLQRHAISPQIG